MDDDPPASNDASAPLYHGTRAELARGAHIDAVGGFAHFSPSLDDAIWAAELADGAAAPRV